MSVINERERGRELNDAIPCVSTVCMVHDLCNDIILLNINAHLTWCIACQCSILHTSTCGWHNTMLCAPGGEYHYKGHEPYKQLIHTVYMLFNTLPPILLLSSVVDSTALAMTAAAALAD